MARQMVIEGHNLIRLERNKMTQSLFVPEIMITLSPSPIGLLVVITHSNEITRKSKRQSVPLREMDCVLITVFVFQLPPISTSWASLLEKRDYESTNNFLFKPLCLFEC
ncbi:hypothetical protein CEXT_268611 [Caerostris extrusa]|uniref:Uncharacterized protein n=1 Tax=Caerostris extrusa TaxID=172846 RepID=A0AAV4N7S3_CAEEX|nr:hypothetical protein CEXT_268611 [Caerostris extrusa]